MGEFKVASRWHSPRLEEEVQTVRWGHIGTPVLLFPTAGGDAEEMERMLMIDALRPLIDAGRIKVYCCDSVAGREMFREDASGEYQSVVHNRFQQFIHEEVVPAIRTDCQTPDIEIITAGASIGAFNACAVTCRYPDAFRAGICLSGTFDLERFLNGPYGDDFYFASPIHWLPNLGGGPVLEQLRERFLLFAFGEGRWEDPEESWRMAKVLGSKGVPNRVDSWGPEYDHNWPTWREMLPKYLDELT